MKWLGRLLVAVIFLMALNFFAPFKGLYFLVEQEVSKYKVNINQEIIEDKAFGIKISDAKIDYDGVALVDVGNIDFRNYTFIQSLNIQNIKLDESYHSFAPANIESIDANLAVWSLHNITAKAYGDFGEAELSFNLFTGELVVVIKNATQSAKSSPWIRMFKRDGKDYKFSRVVL